MKIEGIIRSLANYRGIHTFTIKRDNLGRKVSEEKDIMKLLTEPEIIQLEKDKKRAKLLHQRRAIPE